MNLLILGYYGYNNLGDELLLFSLLQELKNEKNLSIKVLTYNSKDTFKTHEVRTISRGKNLSLIKNIFKSDIVIFGGGSILQDITSSRSLYYYLGIIFLAKLARKKVYLLANGFGPIEKSFNEELIRFLLPKVDLIISRDDESYDNFLKYGAENLHRGTDLVYLSGEYIKNISPLKKNRPYIALSLRNWENIDSIKSEISKAIIYLDSLGYDTFLLPMKRPDDEEIMNDFLELGSFVKVSDNENENLLRILAGSEFVIGMRLHSLILSSVFEKPFIGISYDPKVDSVIKMFYGKKQLDFEDITFEKIKYLIDMTVSNYDNNKENIIFKKNEMKNIASKQMTIFKNHLNESN